MRQRPLLWLLLSVLSCATTFVTWLWGVLSGGLDVAETCRLGRGQVYDQAYRSEHAEPHEVFPLHNRCNASYDLIPIWVNPALVLLALAALGCLLAAVWTTVIRFRRSRLPTA